MVRRFVLAILLITEFDIPVKTGILISHQLHFCGLIY